MHTTLRTSLSTELKQKMDATGCDKRDPYGEVYQSTIRKQPDPESDVLLNCYLTYHRETGYLRIFYAIDTTMGVRLRYLGALRAHAGMNITDRFFANPYMQRDCPEFFALFNSDYLLSVRNDMIQTVVDYV